MDSVFIFLKKSDLYKKCLYASVAHAVMTGKYSLLSDEIAWDGKNFLFQNMQGVRGVIAFYDGGFVCSILNDNDYIAGWDQVIHSFFEGVQPETMHIAKDEVLPYLLIESDAEENVPAVSAAFWANNGGIFSCMTEKSIMKNSDGILLPYLYNYSDMKRYWKNYYDADEEKTAFIDCLYNKRLTCETFGLDDRQKHQMEQWFGSNLTECVQSLKEIGIVY